jgi:hypothetical protein
MAVLYPIDRLVHGWWHLAAFGCYIAMGGLIKVAAWRLEKRWGWR